jgi:hypothetical protein
MVTREGLDRARDAAIACLELVDQGGKRAKSYSYLSDDRFLKKSTRDLLCHQQFYETFCRFDAWQKSYFETLKKHVDEVKSALSGEVRDAIRLANVARNIATEELSGEAACWHEMAEGIAESILRIPQQATLDAAGVEHSTRRFLKSKEANYSLQRTLLIRESFSSTLFLCGRLLGSGRTYVRQEWATAVSRLSRLEDAPIGADTSRLFTRGVPDNTDIRDLVCMLDAERDSGKSRNEIARNFTRESKEDFPKAASLLSQIRRMEKNGRINL